MRKIERLMIREVHAAAISLSLSQERKNKTSRFYLFELLGQNVDKGLNGSVNLLQRMLRKREKERERTHQQSGVTRYQDRFGSITISETISFPVSQPVPEVKVERSIIFVPGLLVSLRASSKRRRKVQNTFERMLFFHAAVMQRIAI